MMMQEIEFSSNWKAVRITTPGSLLREHPGNRGSDFLIKLNGTYPACMSVQTLNMFGWVWHRYIVSIDDHVYIGYLAVTGRITEVEIQADDLHIEDFDAVRAVLDSHIDTFPPESPYTSEYFADMIRAEIDKNRIDTEEQLNTLVQAHIDNLIGRNDFLQSISDRVSKDNLRVDMDLPFYTTGSPRLVASAMVLFFRKASEVFSQLADDMENSVITTDNEEANH